jgi:hypothetical protein
MIILISTPEKHKPLSGIEYLPKLTLQPTPLGLHLEAIAFFDLKSQNKNSFWL